RAHRAAGEWTRAGTIARELLAEPTDGRLRAEALVVLAELEGVHRGVALLEEALAEARSNPALEAVVYCKLAMGTRFEKGFSGALEHARAALELADEVADDALRMDALTRLAFLGNAMGEPDASAHAARAYELARAAGDDERRFEATLELVDWLEVDDLE